MRHPGYSVKHQSWFIPCTKGVIALVDADMVPVLAQYAWHAKAKDGVWTARRTEHLGRGARKHVSMHRQIMSPPDHALIDHKVHIDFSLRVVDNRKANLRPCDASENQWNQRPMKGKASPFKGVSRNSDKTRWCARINVRRKKYHLGTFEDEVSAARAYDQAALKFFGEFAYVNGV